MTYIEFDPFFEPLDPTEVTKITELMEFVNQMPYSTEIVGKQQIVIKDKDGAIVMVLGDLWIEKP